MTKYFIISIITINALLIFNCVNNKDILVEYHDLAGKHVKKIETNTDAADIVLNNKRYSIAPYSLIEVDRNSNISVLRGMIIQGSTKKNRELFFDLMGDRVWGNCSLFYLSIPRKIDDMTGEVVINYTNEDGVFTLKTSMNLIKDKGKTNVYGFYVPYFLYHTILKTDISVNVDENDSLYLSLRYAYKVDRRDWERQEVRFSNAKSAEIKSVDKDKNKKDREKRGAIWSLNNPTPYFLSGFDYPIRDYQYLTSEFGMIREWILNKKVYSKDIHLGIDLAYVKGEPVYSSADGVVKYAENGEYMGNMVIIDHGFSLYSNYMHLDTIDVTPDQFVAKGERIGTIGMTGAATGPHLHWEVRANGIPVDPTSLFFLNEFRNM
jgi:murein DD-endopeptidase MepM/ murein hydrolase activator NlpD